MSAHGLAIRGVCRFCGCTERNACSVAPFNSGDTCSWLDAEQTACNTKDCATKWTALVEARKAEAKSKRPRRLSPAEVHAKICSRNRKPRKPRAA